MSVLFLTGAGISANAGIPTYRDNGASWRDPDLEKKSHSTRYGNHLDELWNKHWGPIGLQMIEADPTPAHYAIAQFQKQNPETIVATQNIDVLHEKAGTDNVAHVHGQATGICMRCKSTNIADFVPEHGAPQCLDCESKKTRPDVILFGEQLNKKLFAGLESFANSPETTHVIAVGTSLNVFPAATLVMDQLGKEKKTILVNKDEVPLQKWFSEAHNVDADSVLSMVLDNVHQEIWSTK